MTNASCFFLKMPALVYKHFRYAPEPSVLPGAVYMFPLALPPSGNAMSTLGLPSEILLVSPFPTDSSLKLSSSTLPSYPPRPVFPVRIVDPVRAQYTLSLEGSSMV